MRPSRSTWTGRISLTQSNGNAGTGLFLLYAAREMHHEPSLDLAVAAGHKLLSLAVHEHGGLTWKLLPDNPFSR